MRLLLALFFSLFVTACDVNIQSEEPAPDPTVQPQDTTSRNTSDTTSRRAYTEDTIARTSTTITLVRRQLLIRGADTSILALDTVRLLNGGVIIDTALSVLPPCPSGALTIYNGYGSPIVLELWTGNSMEYLSGRVYGTNLQKVARVVLPADSAHNRLCQDWPATQYGLVIAGITPEPGGPAYLLGHGQFQLSSSSLLVVDDEGLIRPLH